MAGECEEKKFRNKNYGMLQFLSQTVYARRFVERKRERGSESETFMRYIYIFLSAKGLERKREEPARNRVVTMKVSDTCDYRNAPLNRLRYS